MWQKGARLKAEMAWAYSDRSIEDVAREFDLGINRLLEWLEFDAVYRIRNDGTKEIPADPHFQDMRLRIINAAPCPIEFVPGQLGSWPYGTLFIAEGGIVIFGDLTIRATQAQIQQFIMLAAKK